MLGKDRIEDTDDPSPLQTLIADLLWHKCIINQPCLPSTGAWLCHPPVHTQLLGWSWLWGSLKLETCIPLLAWLVSQHTSLTPVNPHSSNYRSSGKQLSTMLWRETERWRPCDIWNMVVTCWISLGDVGASSHCSPEWILLSMHRNVLGELGQKKAELNTAQLQSKIRYHYQQKGNPRGCRISPCSNTE